MWATIERRAIEHMDIGTLPDDLWRVYIELHILAHLHVENDDLTLYDMAWMIHRDYRNLEELLGRLHGRGINPLKEIENYRQQRARRIRWGKLREQVLGRDQHTCGYCGSEADSVDHIIPLSRGGPDKLDNLVAACRSCNTSKGDRTPEEAGMNLWPVGDS